nr:CoB--CoM heterodisulfide reductase iron-sulfur subunit B family protein [Desulfobacterales bacterium]
MKVHYYPGCSLEGTAREYDQSTRAVMAALGVELQEIEGWTCCGASAAEAVSELLAVALPARNLALAERQSDLRDVLVPCSACYLNLKLAAEKLRTGAALQAAVNSLLEEEGLRHHGRLSVRHLLDLFATGIGPEAVRSRVTRTLSGLRIAPYYGCQCLRPFAVFDDPEMPTSMEPLIRATGAEVFPWAMGGRCCGASHMNTRPEVGMALVAGILEAARGADAIATVCPMCQMNLEAFQSAVSRSRHRDLHVTILYLPQLIGLALGRPGVELGLNFNLALA